MSKKALSTLMDAQVTRKQFLTMLGLGIVGLTGLSGFFDAISRQGSNAVKQGYGYGPYGGEAAVVKSAEPTN